MRRNNQRQTQNVYSYGMSTELNKNRTFKLDNKHVKREDKR